MKKITAEQIIENINARLQLLNEQQVDKSTTYQLQDLLNDICRHRANIENIDCSTDRHNQWKDQ